MFDDESRFALPERPPHQRGLDVAAWSEAVVIPTYRPGRPSRLPAFLDKRVFQGSSGRVYPLPFIESVSQDPVDTSWEAVHLENELLRVVVLPELGGRVHVVLDKTTGRDLFYRNNVIKPALVGLAGPWISGGIEFNWPQHHRPGTYLPTEWSIEREADGSVTVWCSDHDPFARMRGSHGIRLRPGSSLLEARVRLFNRTETTQTFLWWANVAVRVHDDYQSFFPTDVHVVADHAKRAVTSFPAADGEYYGVDYPSRVDAEHPDADRLDWYRNIPVPTSYMCLGSDDDFFGGYDHAADLGFVHVADHHVAPGKKQWTWGNSAFGWAWDDNLTDSDGPYVELMAGAYTDNQPDFSYLAPGETKAFSQFWYPLHGTGIIQQATRDVAVRLDLDRSSETAARFAVESTRVIDRASITLRAGGGIVFEQVVALAPGQPFTAAAPVPASTAPSDLTLTVDEGEVELIRSSPRVEPGRVETPEPATALPLPADIASSDELYLAGIHLEQYRHATRSPEPYWQELLDRDPLDSRANVALATRRYRSGRLAEAEEHLRAAIARETRRNPNPATGEAHYLLGLVLRRRGDDKGAYDALSKALWNAAWRVPAHVALARLDLGAGRPRAALEHAEAAVALDADNGQAALLSVLALRDSGRHADGDRRAAERAQRDALDWWAQDLARRPLDATAEILVDVALEYESTGRLDDALRVLASAADVATSQPVEGAGNPLPLIHYRRAELARRLGREAEAASAAKSAVEVDADRCFVGRLDDALLLERRLLVDAGDARAHALLAHWLYSAGRFDEAIDHLQSASRLDPSDAVVWRGLGLAAFNVLHDARLASEHYERALAISGDDAKLLSEADQLAAKTGVPPAQRLARLQSKPDLVAQRDDLTLTVAELLAIDGDADSAVDLILKRRFQPWEGGEGEALRVWSLANLVRAGAALQAGDAGGSLKAVLSAIDAPGSLGEARHPLANFADLLLAEGDAREALGDTDGARRAWVRAATSAGDFSSMSTVPFSPMTYSSIVAARRLGDTDTADRLLDGLSGFVAELRTATPTVDYFATSLPTMLIFDDDLVARQSALVALLTAQLLLLDGRQEAATGVLDELTRQDPADSRALLLARQATSLASPAAS